MKKEKKNELSLVRDERGAGLSEYLVLLVLVVVACIVVWQQFQDKVETKMNDVGTSIESMQ